MQATPKLTYNNSPTNTQIINLTSELHSITCPRCQNKKNTKYGNVKGNQRYKCSKCGKHFRTTTGNSIHHLHLKAKIEAYIQCMNEGLSLRKTAKQVDISLQTAFRWRHRFLSAMRKHNDTKQNKHQTISAYTLPFSNKGQKKNNKNNKPITSIIRTDITGTTSIDVIGRYGQTPLHILRQTNKNSTYIPSISIPKVVKHRAIRCKNQPHNNKTNTMHKEIHNWLNKFRGVATKYLQNYWEWFTHQWQLQLNISEIHQYMFKCL